MIFTKGSQYLLIKKGFFRNKDQSQNQIHLREGLYENKYFSQTLFYYDFLSILLTYSVVWNYGSNLALKLFNERRHLHRLAYTEPCQIRLCMPLCVARTNIQLNSQLLTWNGCYVNNLLVRLHASFDPYQNCSHSYVHCQVYVLSSKVYFIIFPFKLVSSSLYFDNHRGLVVSA